MNTVPFQFLVLLEPLGLLYGSSGRMLSPQALTGRASEHFPPDSPTIAGLIAKHIERPTNLPKEETPLWNRTPQAPSASTAKPTSCGCRRPSPCFRTTAAIHQTTRARRACNTFNGTAATAMAPPAPGIYLRGRAFLARPARVVGCP
jgi:hypothetical protein